MNSPTPDTPVILYWPTKATRYHTQRCQYVKQTKSDVYKATKSRIKHHELSECQACYALRVDSDKEARHTGKQSNLAHRLTQANPDDVSAD